MKKTAKELSSTSTGMLQTAEGSPTNSFCPLSSDPSPSQPPLSYPHLAQQQNNHSNITPSSEAHIISFPSPPVQFTKETARERIPQQNRARELAEEDVRPHHHQLHDEEHRCGPFQFHPESEPHLSNDQLEEASHPDPLTPLVRSYDCKHYDCCLELAAALNWENFTCSGCGGDINQHLVWKANLAKREDEVANRLCKKTRIQFA